MKNKTTQKLHRTDGKGYTLCGIKINEFSNIINDEGLTIPATSKTYQFEPYKSLANCECEVCDKSFYEKAK